MSGLFTNLYGQDSPSEQVADIAARTAQASADLTDNTTGAASTTLAAGAGQYWLTFNFDAADFANGDMVTTMTVGHKFKILNLIAVCTKAVTTGAKAATLNLEIGTTDLTGGVLALSGAYSLGAVTACTAITAANTGSAAATISLEASSVTAFAEGRFSVGILIQNMDTADAIASLAAQSDALVVESAASIAKDNLIRTNFRAKGWMA